MEAKEVGWRDAACKRIRHLAAVLFKKGKWRTYDLGPTNV